MHLLFKPVSSAFALSDGYAFSQTARSLVSAQRAQPLNGNDGERNLAFLFLSCPAKLIYGFRQNLAGPAEAARSIILLFAALGSTAVLVDEIVRRFHASLALSQLGSADRCNDSDDSCARFRAHRTSARAALIWALFSERITCAYGSRRVFDVSCRFSEIATEACTRTPLASDRLDSSWHQSFQRSHSF